MLRASLALALAVTVACHARDPLPIPDASPPVEGDGGLDGGNPDGGAPAVSLASVEPTSGLVSGGTPIVLRGEGFQDGALVTVGDLFADDVVVVSAQEVHARTPPALDAATVDVHVINPGGGIATLRRAFTYLLPPPLVIDECLLVPVQGSAVAPGERFEVRGRVLVEGYTSGPGAAERLRAQAGYGFPGTAPSSWTWLPATYAGDADGLAPGDLAFDEFLALLSIPLPGTFLVAFRASGDGGATWQLCDLDGLAGGFSVDALPQVRVRTPSVGFCSIEAEVARVRAGARTGPVEGLVRAEGITDAGGPSPLVRAQIGYGPVGEPPNGMLWIWTDAEYAASGTGPPPESSPVHRYSGSFTAPSPGRYDVAYRFSLDEGRSWTYCDRDGSPNGYASAQAMRLEVIPAGGGIDDCRLEAAAALEVVLGGSVHALAAVRVDGITGAPGPGSGVRAELGFGPPASAAGGPSWSWARANYEGDLEESDLYGAMLAPLLPGTFAVAARFSVDEGASWSYCDRDGLANGFDLGAASRMTVSPLSVAWCAVDRPASAEAAAGEPAEFFGRVKVPGRTPGTGRGAGVAAQIGVGPEAADPESWTWFAAEYTADVDGDALGDLALDEYRGLAVVSTAGSYRVAFRFSVDGGQTWTPCGLDGGAFEPSAAAILHVNH